MLFVLSFPLFWNLFCLMLWDYYTIIRFFLFCYFVLSSLSLYCLFYCLLVLLHLFLRFSFSLISVLFNLLLAFVFFWCFFFFSSIPLTYFSLLRCYLLVYFPCSFYKFLLSLPIIPLNHHWNWVSCLVCYIPRHVLHCTWHRLNWNGMLLEVLAFPRATHFTYQKWIPNVVYRIRCVTVCKILCSKSTDIAEKLQRRMWRKSVNTKHFTF